MRDLVQIHRQRVAVGIEESSRLLGSVAVCGRTAVLGAVRRRRRHTITTRRLRLLHLTRRVTATIFAKVDLELPVVVSASDGLNRLDGVGDVGEVHKSTALLTQSVDKLNLTILGKVLS